MQGAQTSLSRSLVIQSRVIGALLMREVLTRYGRHNIGFMWLFIEPMLFTLGIVALWTATRSVHNASLPIVAFAVTGYSSVLLWRNTVNRCTKALGPNLTLLYHRNVKVLDVFAARILLELLGSTMAALTLASIFIAIGWMKPPEDIVKVLVGWLLLAWFGASLALMMGVLSERSEILDRIWHTLTYLLFPLSGAVYMVDWLPKAAQSAVLWLPMVHGVEILREGYFGSSVHAHYSLAYVSFFCLVMTLFGLALVRNLGHTVTPE